MGMGKLPRTRTSVRDATVRERSSENGGIPPTAQQEHSLTVVPLMGENAAHHERPRGLKPTARKKEESMIICERQILISGPYHESP